MEGKVENKAEERWRGGEGRGAGVWTDVDFKWRVEVVMFFPPLDNDCGCALKREMSRTLPSCGAWIARDVYGYR